MRLGSIMRDHCYFKRISGRELSKQTGLGISTVSRFLNGKSLDMTDFAKLMVWLIQADNAVIDLQPLDSKPSRGHSKAQS
jgi:hypothetical protein